MSTEKMVPLACEDIHKVEYEADEGKSRVRKNSVMGGDCG
jgi:hypothetical protein